MRTVCSVDSWNSYFECVGVCVMIGCLILAECFFLQQANDGVRRLTNYAVMGVLGLVLLFASLIPVKKISSRWWRNALSRR